MFLGLTTLAVAIVISVVAAYYSILGLTAIFAAAFWPIVIMGGALEVGKIMTAVWLHRNWNRASWAYKSYLIPALVVLMILTSMGIFGFLSKAHLDQSIPTGDVAAQVALIDEKINNERETIANARSLLSQLDKAVVDISNGPDREIKLRDGTTRVQTSAERALQIRRQQARDRANLTATIETAQATIVQLQEQKSPIASELRKVEAKVGPIKYVASMIYGDNPDENLLEKAVRWVIVLIVIVFDPLAVVLILAGSKQIEWDRIRTKSQDETTEPTIVQPMVAQDKSSEEHVDITVANNLSADIVVEPDIDLIKQQAQAIKEAEERTEEFHQKIKLQEIEIDKFVSIIEQLGDDILVLEQQVADDIKEKNSLLDTNSSLTVDLQQKNAEIADLKRQQKELHDQMQEALVAAEQAINELEGLKAKTNSQAEKQISTDGFAAVADTGASLPAGSNVSFGSGFPSNPEKGDLYLRVDYLPTKLFKWNSTKWIEVDKNATDLYAYNEQYIKHLVDSISSGEYDQDDLNDIERTQIAEYLKKSK